MSNVLEEIEVGDDEREQLKGASTDLAYEPSAPGKNSLNERRRASISSPAWCSANDGPLKMRYSNYKCNQSNCCIALFAKLTVLITKADIHSKGVNSL